MTRWHSRLWVRLAVAGVAVLSVAAVAAALVFAGLGGSTQREPLARTRLTERVERRVLVSEVVTRGSVESVGDTPVSCYPSSVDSEVKVFTREPRFGERLDEGEVVAAVNGRPILLLAGKIPAFRTIIPGSSGDDVRQLQAGLRRLGYPIADAKGVFGSSTQAAVEKWYASQGFAATGPTAAEAAGLRAAEEAVRQAKSSLSTAAAALKEAEKGPSRSALLGAELAVESARLEVGKAVGAEKAMARKQLAIAKAGLAELKRHPELTAARSARSEASKALRQAERELAASRGTVGISIPYCEVVFVPSTPAGVARAAARGADTDQSSGTGTGTGGWASLASGELLLVARVDGRDGDLVKAGAKVSFRSNADVKDARGVVLEVEPDVASGQTTVMVKPDEPFDEADRGKSLRVEIEIESTSGEVLVVPVAGVSGTADGLAQVERLSGQATAMVRVRAGLSAAGFVEVAPVEPGTLDAGDEIVVGR